MIKNFLKIAIRNIYKNKTISLINITGLAIGIASCLLIFLYVNEELNYDTHHANHDRIFRVVEEIESKMAQRNFAPIAWPAAPALVNKFPQIENAARIYTFISSRLIKYKNKNFYEDRFIFAENDIFKILTLPLISGNPEFVLEKPFTVVITENIAKKYFNDENPVGKIININTNDYEITGVMQNIPRNTHLKFDFIASMKTIEDESWMSNWWGTECYTYIKLKPNVDHEIFQAQMINIADDLVGEQIKAKNKSYRFPLQPISDIHLYSNLRYEIESPGSITSLIIFIIIGSMVLLNACINFINLVTARSVNRAKEVGIRKVVGGYKSQIIFQFLGESFLIVLISLIIAIIIVKFAIPYFNSLLVTSYSETVFFQPQVILVIFLSILVMGFGAGIYPAMILSSYKEVSVLKGSFKSGSKGTRLRKAFVIGQFTISIALIISTIVIYQQLDFMKNRYLGFEKMQKLVIPIKGGASIRSNSEFVKNEFLKHSSIIGATASSSVPGRSVSNYGIRLVGKDDDKSQSMFHLYFDADFIKNLNIEMVAGRSFSNEIATDVSQEDYPESGGFLINESAAKVLGCKSANEAIELRLNTGMGGRTGPIIGVTKDFHFRGLQSVVEPLVMEWYPSIFDNLILNIKIDDLNETQSFIEQKWGELFPGVPYECFFLDNDFNSQYKSDEQMGKITTVFTLLGIFIACLGLLGLASFTVVQRTKEIGIRKVMGATESNIIFVLTKEFTKWVLYANIIAWPLAWIAMNSWLQNFAYRTEMQWWVFLLSGGIALFISVLTVSLQAIKTALANPIDSLRYE